ncbi:hypothetical protein BV25DRAFT_1920853 [Artomyces pyxidatus]|uniref:Uncharacterized protein n=1 Tax=Artomyces pyxidatus TaxID=48021 RepID=A0ACB8SK73_9AGAM|nr:hypothetical protein BV25DRAFT_1920853 [Artomyces pyxidatus]
MYTLPPTASAQLHTVHQWYEAVTRWDVAKLDELFTPDYRHVSLPASVGEADKGKKEGLALVQFMASLFNGKAIDYEWYDVNETDGKIWVHSKMYGKTPKELAFNNESIFQFTLRAEGEGIQIAEIREFVDTKATAEFAQGLAGAA